MPKRGYYTQEVLKLRKVNSDLTYKEALKVIPDLKEITFYKILERNPIDDSIDGINSIEISKINGKVKPRVIPPLKNQSLSSNPSLSNHTPEQLLFLGMTRQIELDPNLFRLYIKQGLYARDQEERTQSYNYYKRPDFFNDYQHKLIQIFRRGSCLIVGARQKTWKTTTGLIAALEEMNENPNSTINFLSTSKPLAVELVGKIETDERVHSVWEPYLFGSYAEKRMIKNGSRLIPLATTRANAKGRTARILWIDELDDFFLIAGCLDVLAAAVPQIITTMASGGKVWITCNMGETRGFHMFVEIMKKFGDLFPIYEIIEPDGQIYTERTIVRLNPPEKDSEIMELNQDTVDYIVHSILTLAKDKRYADAMVYNIKDTGTDPFPAELVTEAFESWNAELIPKYPINCVESVDPGFTHATGVIILKMDKDGHIWEAYAHEFFGGEITEEKFKQRIFVLYKDHGVKELYCEPNSGGSHWMFDWDLRGMNCISSTFGVGQPTTGDVSHEHKAYERVWYERVLKDLLEKRKIHLHNEILFNEFGKYDPNKSKDKNKGDLVDALLIAIFWIVGGPEYIYNNLIDKEIIDQGETTILL